MGAVAGPLLEGLAAQLRRFAADGLPLTGVVGAPGLRLLLDPEAALRAAIAGADTGGGGSLDGGFLALRMLPQQHAVLAGSEPETRVALHGWCDLQDQWRRRVRTAAGLPDAPPPLLSPQAASGPLPSPAAAAAFGTAAAAMQVEAAESAAWLVHRLALQPGVDACLLEDEAEERRRAIEEEALGAQRALDEMAAQVRAQSGGLFGGGGSSSAGPAPGEASASAASERLDALRGCFFGAPFKFKPEPVEWVYDGLAPALLPGVLERRKGAPLALALAAAALARRLGLAPRLACAGDGEVMGTEPGPAVGRNLPPGVAARQAGRVVAAPPAVNTWLVAVGVAAPGGGEPAVYLDVSRRGGELLTPSQAAARYPALEPAEIISPASVGDQAAPGGACIMRIWAEMARTLVTAHQRRGESDLVAHWMYQALALDAAAPEWGRALGGQR